MTIDNEFEREFRSRNFRERSRCWRVCSAWEPAEPTWDTISASIPNLYFHVFRDINSGGSSQSGAGGHWTADGVKRPQLSRRWQMAVSKCGSDTQVRLR